MTFSSIVHGGTDFSEFLQALESCQSVGADRDVARRDLQAARRFRVQGLGFKI